MRQQGQWCMQQKKKLQIQQGYPISENSDMLTEKCNPKLCGNSLSQVNGLLREPQGLKRGHYQNPGVMFISLSKTISSVKEGIQLFIYITSNCQMTCILEGVDQHALFSCKKIHNMGQLVHKYDHLVETLSHHGLIKLLVVCALQKKGINYNDIVGR